jgi:hypothetical protein
MSSAARHPSGEHLPWESVLGRQQRSRSPHHEAKACAPTKATPWRFVPATWPCWPLDEHAEFGRLRVRRDGCEPDVARGRILSMDEGNGAARWQFRKQLKREFWIRRNELGIPLPCPQIRGSNGVSRGGSRGPPQGRRARPLRPSRRNAEILGARRDIDLAAAAALPGGMKGSNDHVFGPDYCPNLDHLE